MVKLEQPNQSLIKSALAARRSGVSTIPVTLPSKRPPKGLLWKSRQEVLPDETTIRQDMAGGNGDLGLAVIGGTVSGNLEIFDFDLSGEFYSPFISLVEDEAPDLINRLPIQQTMSNGSHVLLRCPQTVIPGNKKLARKQIEVPGPGQHEHDGKKYQAQQRADKWYIYPVAIETRGQGGGTLWLLLLPAIPLFSQAKAAVFTTSLKLPQQNAKS
jgi:hypothetical protein